MLPLPPLIMLTKLIGFYNLVSIVLNYLVMLIVPFEIKPIDDIVPRLPKPFIFAVSWPTLEKRYFSPLRVPIAVSFLACIPILYLSVFLSPRLLFEDLSPEFGSFNKLGILGERLTSIVLVRARSCCGI